MNKALSSIAFVGALALAAPAFAQPAAAPQAPSSFYPAPPPDRAPVIEKGASTSNLSSPLPTAPHAVERTIIDSDAEAQLFAEARRISWGRYAKIKGAKPGELMVTKQGNVWVVKGRIDSVAPGTEGDWAFIDGVVERIGANVVQIRGEVGFRVAKVEKGVPCKVAGLLNFRRSGKSQVWRLAEGDNPCDGTREGFDLVMEKPVEKKPVPTQPKRS
ncbi:MAG: hypothetical protein EPO10_27710 [Reyranella sp.]|uniref:hypothetical protein n=1 Tax=Reyranella sp. TaxID=1929291 RepID=UPI0012005409|nr:hypothetical protein [Reyranella sp.]TAJ94719.1 MAG: hypothetical protein EPO41_11650 [Reyranella sp.]TBR22902.1 MAG: hypothetical protein EPO10_27710 [Reyranella sp.]